MVRLYAARYPDEVVGLVLVDPEHERIDVEMSKLDPAYWEDVWGGYQALRGTLPEAAFAELDEAWNITRTGVLPEVERIPDLATVVITSLVPDTTWLGGTREGKRIWRALHGELFDASPHRRRSM